MLTPLTQKAIAVLHDIALKENNAADKYDMSPDELAMLLARLESKMLIYRIPEGAVNEESSYRMCRPLSQMSLLDVLEALNENLNCNRPTTEEFYTNYGRVAQKLGVVNHMTRLYLEEIKLSEC